MKLKLLFATGVIFNLAVSEAVLAQANFGNRPLDINRAPQSQTIKDFNRRVQKEVDLLQINRDDILNIPNDYGHLDSNIGLSENDVRTEEKVDNSTIFELEQNSELNSALEE